MKNLIRLLLIVISLLVVVALSSSLFLAAGYAISAVLPLTLFEAGLLAVGSSFVVVFSVAASMLLWQIPLVMRSLVSDNMEDEGEEESDDDFYEDDEEDEDVADEGRLPARSDKHPRNALCSCGSGRKYKYCCGK